MSSLGVPRATIGLGQNPTSKQLNLKPQQFNPTGTKPNLEAVKPQQFPASFSNHKSSKLLTCLTCFSISNYFENNIDFLIGGNKEFLSIHQRNLHYF
jgi:hypothetical protein